MQFKKILVLCLSIYFVANAQSTLTAYNAPSNYKRKFFCKPATDTLLLDLAIFPGSFVFKEFNHQ